MKTLCIQHQPDRHSSIASEDDVARLLTKLGIVAEVRGGLDDGRYINHFIETSDPEQTWAELRPELLGNSNLANATIVTCEGDRGWDDYLLLHHFDGTVTLDEL